jgi:Asp-tRNA(Asn)/Glu-tRNA(Gln) amidotransferase A subunit family amidase
MIPVPSRHYFETPSKAKPLNGKRVAVKDIFHVRGVETSAGCKAYSELYGDAKVTSSVISKLIELGAVLVGKTHTVPFAGGAEPHDWIDYQCPFNPRGDGYSTTSGSSVGSAVGIAAYSWLDFAIGSDSKSLSFLLFVRDMRLTILQSSG